MRGLQNKVAIVAGAAPRNIGGATALRLAQEGMKLTIAASRLGAPADIAGGMVAFLFADGGAYVNGQTIVVDCGAQLT